MTILSIAYSLWKIEDLKAWLDKYLGFTLPDNYIYISIFFGSLAIGFNLPIIIFWDIHDWAALKISRLKIKISRLKVWLYRKGIFPKKWLNKRDVLCLGVTIFVENIFNYLSNPESLNSNDKGTKEAPDPGTIPDQGPPAEV